MQNLHFTHYIQAAPSAVWGVLFSNATYPIWTKGFGANSRVEGDFLEGGKLLFIGTDSSGHEGGMVSRVAKLQPNEFMSIEHQGIYYDGVEDTSSEQTRQWTPTFEQYTLVAEDRGTMLTVDMQSPKEYADMFRNMWQKSLAIVALLSEIKQTPALIAEVTVQAPLANVWHLFTAPEHIIHWNQASPDWHTPRAVNDLRMGGTFSSHMAAKDGSASFDFTGTYTEVEPQSLLTYDLYDARKVVTIFNGEGDATRITTVFEPETENAPQLQQQGWQAIIQSFKEYAQAHE